MPSEPNRIDHTHVENLQPGDWVVIVDMFSPEHDQIPPEFMEGYSIYPVFSSWCPTIPSPISQSRSPFENGPISLDIDGMPLCVLAVSLPFIGVTDGASGKAAIDVRRYRVRKVTPEYAEIMNPFTTDFVLSEKDGVRRYVASHEEKPGELEPPSEDAPKGWYCPHCGERMDEVTVGGRQQHVCRNGDCGGLLVFT